MGYQFLLILLQISVMNSAPILVMPIPWMPQTTQQDVLQKQLMELQAIRQLNTQPSVQTNNQQQPMIILLPKQNKFPTVKSNEKLHTENHHKIMNTNEYEDEDLNSVVIDAESEATDKDMNEGIEQDEVNPEPQRAILLIPNARLSIGGIVSAIPWLPIEINVPDTISWVYNGIASGIGSIISIIGRPFQEIQIAPQEGLKSVLKQIQTKQNMASPIVMMPIVGPIRV